MKQKNPRSSEKNLQWQHCIVVVLRSEIPSGMCAKLRTAAASNNRDHASKSLFAYASVAARRWRHM